MERSVCRLYYRFLHSLCPVGMTESDFLVKPRTERTQFAVFRFIGLHGVVTTQEFWLKFLRRDRNSVKLPRFVPQRKRMLSKSCVVTVTDTEREPERQGPTENTSTELIANRPHPSPRIFLPPKTLSFSALQKRVSPAAGNRFYVTHSATDS